MQIGINEKIEPEVIRYYDAFYDILRTPDFNDETSITVVKQREGEYHIS